MHISRYEIFLKIVETNSLTKTAEYYHYTQSAISQSVKALEKELNLTLFRRDSQGVDLTEEGKYILPAIREIAVGEWNLSARCSELQHLNAGAIRIAAFISMSCHWLPPRLKEFNQQYPNITFDLMSGDYRQVLALMESGSADLGFMTEPAEPDLKFTQLIEDRMMIVLPEEHPLAKRDGIELQQLEQEKWILLEGGYKEMLMKMLRDSSLRPNVSYLVKDDYTIMSMVENGLGISILPELVLRRTPYRIKTVPSIPAYVRKLGFVIPEKRSSTWAVKKFAEYLSAKVTP